MAELEKKVETLPDGTEVTTTVEEAPERAPNPQDNPRNAVLASIAKQAFRQHDADAEENAKVPVVDDDGNTATPAAAPPSDEPTPPEAAPPASSPAETAAPAREPAAALEVIDPNAEYDVVVEGQTIKVKGSLIIDAGKRTFSKETAADFRLRTASQLLEEAEKRLAATQPGASEQPKPQQQPASKSEAELAQMLQFGTAEQSAEAVRVLLSRGMPQEDIMRLSSDAARTAARDEYEFQRAKSFIAHEYRDIMERPALRNLFSSEEERLRRGGDKRPYGELYKAIGDSIRKDFGLQKPAAAPSAQAPASGSKEARTERKAAAPSVPRTATARLQETQAPKPKSSSEIIAAMAERRGQHRLTPLRKE